ncbi:hypothetical protein AB1Y20_001160 [Prymnesium parvum]|uniref:Rieske domain-containing protein n=1 Tax=Prymnesium parvum TaxID=97485 RepID=A0AB34KCS5_PRYPA
MLLTISFVQAAALLRFASQPYRLGFIPPVETARLRRPVRATAEQAALAAAWSSWPRAWVPLASTFELDPERPTPVRFLGRTFVVWQDNDADWRAFEDACPHRLAPLSEGRIDRHANALECAYHGWQFTPTGSCARIPQAEPKVQKTACASSKACVKAYPLHVEKSVVFVWPWSGVPPDPNAKEGDASPTQSLAEMALPRHQLASVVPGASTYTRDLPYGWDTLLENIVDPSHIPFAHHGLQGKREDAIPINMSDTITVKETGFDFKFEDRTGGRFRSGSGEFRAPYVISYAAEYLPKPGAPAPPPGTPPRTFNLTLAMIPISAGWSRAIIFGAKNDYNAPKPSAGQEGKGSLDGVGSQPAKGKKKKASIFAIIFGLMPIWLTHMLSSRFLDSDLAFLHYQEQEIQRRGTLDYFMPAPADRPIGALRKWLAEYIPSLGPLPPPIWERSRLLDRWAQHSSHCVHCQRGLEGVNRWRQRVSATLALSLIGFKWMPFRFVAATCLALLGALQAIGDQFKWQDFKHYQNH